MSIHLAYERGSCQSRDGIVVPRAWAKARIAGCIGGAIRVMIFRLLPISPWSREMKTDDKILQIIALRCVRAEQQGGGRSEPSQQIRVARHG